MVVEAGLAKFDRIPASILTLSFVCVSIYKCVIGNILLRNILDVAITEHKGNYILQIGLQNGVLLRTTIDSVTGEISDTRTRYLGTKSVKLFKVKTEGESAVLAVSSRSWLSYS